MRLFVAGGGGYSLWWPIRGGSLRKGYLSQASGIRVGKSVIWVCKRAQTNLWLENVGKPSIL